MSTSKKRRIDLLGYLPEYLQEYKEIQNIMLAENTEIDAVSDECKTILNNMFITGCDENGIKRFEKLLGIDALDNETLEFRQSRAMIAWNNTIPYTLRSLENKLIAVQGNDDVQLNVSGYKLNIVTHMDNAGQIKSMRKLFDKMIPCNMQISHKNVIRCNAGCSANIGIGISGTEVVKIY